MMFNFFRVFWINAMHAICPSQVTRSDPEKAANLSIRSASNAPNVSRSSRANITLKMIELFAKRITWNREKSVQNAVKPSWTQFCKPLEVHIIRRASLAHFAPRVWTEFRFIWEKTNELNVKSVMRRHPLKNVRDAKVPFWRIV